LDFINLLTWFDANQLIELTPYKPTDQVDVSDKFIKTLNFWLQHARELVAKPTNYVLVAQG
jgi:hypothetical protein